MVTGCSFILHPCRAGRKKQTNKRKHLIENAKHDGMDSSWILTLPFRHYLKWDLPGHGVVCHSFPLHVPLWMFSHVLVKLCLLASLSSPHHSNMSTEENEHSLLRGKRGGKKLYRFCCSSLWASITKKNLVSTLSYQNPHKLELQQAVCLPKVWTNVNKSLWTHKPSALYPIGSLLIIKPKKTPVLLYPSPSTGIHKSSA